MSRAGIGTYEYSHATLPRREGRRWSIEDAVRRAALITTPTIGETENPSHAEPGQALRARSQAVGGVGVDSGAGGVRARQNWSPETAPLRKSLVRNA